MHVLRYGTSAPAEPAEIVSLRATVTGPHAQAAAGEDQARHERAAESRFTGKRPVFFDGKFRDAPTYRARRAAAPATASRGRR